MKKASTIVALLLVAGRAGLSPEGEVGFHMGKIQLGRDMSVHLAAFDQRLEGLLESTGIEHPRRHFCKACFDGCYPVAFDQDISKDCLERG